MFHVTTWPSSLKQIIIFHGIVGYTCGIFSFSKRATFEFLKVKARINVYQFNIFYELLNVFGKIQAIFILF